MPNKSTDVKHCSTCDIDQPVSNFTSKQARVCNRCKQLKQLKQLRDSQKLSIERLKNRKPKKATVVRLSDLKKIAQRAVNKFIRERDADEPCMACQKPCRDGGDASHFVAQGSSGFLRYHPDNIWKCCTSCNRYKHGNLLEFRINLVKKIGVERVEWLEEHRNDVKRWTREELEEIIEKAKNGELAPPSKE